MKYMKTVVIPTKSVELEDYATCDLCNKRIEYTPGYDIDKVEITHRKGSEVPDSGYGVETTIDMCGECFDQRLVPWVRMLGGADIKPKDWDW